jgi:6-phosphofructokinase
MHTSPLLYLQSGGPTAVLNLSALGVIETARRLGRPLLAARDGLSGLIHGQLVDTGQVSDAEIQRLRFLPGASFGVSRHMIPSFDEAPEQWRAALRVLQQHDIHHLLVNGGNGSLGCAARLVEFERHTGYPLSVIGIPKTIDNDLVGTDFSPGFPSAAKFLATMLREVAVDMRSMDRQRVFIMEAMGRHTGWLAAATAAAGQQAGDAPHLILLPEVAFEPARFLERVTQCLQQYGHCAIVVAEGLKDASGKLVAESRHDDVYGHEQLGGAGLWVAGLIKQQLDITAHVAQVDCLQRAARHLGSAVDVRLAYACGCRAVEWAVDGKQGVMTSFVRQQDNPPRWDIVPASLAEIGDQEWLLPAEYIDADNFSVTAAFHQYIRPLLAGAPALPESADGLPDCRQIDWPGI